MNKVKKSLDEISQFSLEDVKEIKGQVHKKRRRPNKRNPFPMMATLIVATTILFFSFNLFINDRLTSKEDAYIINETLYHYMLTQEKISRIDDNVEEIKQEVFAGLIEAEALYHFALENGYEEQTEQIEMKIDADKESFYEDLDEENRNQMMQAHEEMYGISYDDYFNVILKYTFRYSMVYDWIIEYVVDKPVTLSEMIRSFEAKHQESLTAFMKKEQIASFNIVENMEKIFGTIVRVEDDRIALVDGYLEEDFTFDELLSHHLIVYFKVKDAKMEFHENMTVRITYDRNDYVPSHHDNPTVYEQIEEWSEIFGTREESTEEHELAGYAAQNLFGLEKEDIDNAFQMISSLLEDYYMAVWNGEEIDLSIYIHNENLLNYMTEKIVAERAVKQGVNIVKEVHIGDWKYEEKIDLNGKAYVHYSIPVKVVNNTGSFGENIQFLVQNEFGILLVADWYNSTKDGYDFTVRGNIDLIDQPNIWDDDDWVQSLKR